MNQSVFFPLDERVIIRLELTQVLDSKSPVLRLLSHGKLAEHWAVQLDCAGKRVPIPRKSRVPPPAFENTTSDTVSLPYCKIDPVRTS